MATERTTERDNGITTERTVEREPSGGTTVVRTGGSGAGVLIGIVVLAVVALVALLLVLQANRTSPGQQVADAAGGVATATSRAANGAADAVNPNR